MRVLSLLVSILLATICLIQLPAETSRMPLDQVRPGMTGFGITVFQGATREEFQVEVLGILTNVMGPQRNVIIVRLSGGPLATTGVIQGMSGSPVYIDDRLVGALSYSLGSFSKEAIAGITPIDEMIATDQASRTLNNRVQMPLRLPVTKQNLSAVVGEIFGSGQAFATRTEDIDAVGLQVSEAARLGTFLRPIATPLVLSGFLPELQDLWASAFRVGGFVTTVGGTMTAEAQAEVRGLSLKAGDSVGVSLVSGDLTLAGTGTVTMVENDRVYAFGHPFYNLGPVRFPMTRAHVTTLLPSLAISSKIAAIGNILGTIEQDRPTGIYGNLGPGPTLIPVRVTLSETGRNLHKTFNFQIVDDPLFTPLLTYTTVLNTFIGWTRELGPRTYMVKGTARLRDNTNISLQDIYTGERAAVDAASAIATPLSALLANEFEPVQIEGIDIKVSSVEEPRTATLERIWIDAARPRAGELVSLKILSRTYRGAERLETLMIPIPMHATGQVAIQVSDALTLDLQEKAATRSRAATDTLDRLIRNLNRTRRNNRLYVKLIHGEPGAIDRGERMPALPGSVLAVMEGNRSGGGLGRLEEATLGEWEIVSDHVMSGSRRIIVTIEQ